MSLSITIIFVIILAGLFGWLALRAWRARRPLVKWPGVILAGLLAALCVVVTGSALFGLYKVYMPPVAPAPAIEVVRSPEQLNRGERLAHLCAACHSTSGKPPLDGSAENMVPPMGMLYAPNLTPSGSLRNWSDGEIIRAIREGVNQNGQALRIMPSNQYHLMSDADVHSLVAYLRSQPPAERQTPEPEVSFLNAVLIGLGIFPIGVQPPVTGPIEAPPLGPTVEHGGYLVTISGCGECHGETLQGGTSQFVPVGPNLPVIVSGWSSAEFIETMRTGVDPYGHKVDPETMPWESYAAAYTDEELEAIYEYILSLSPAE